MYLIILFILLASCVHESQQAQLHNYYILKTADWHGVDTNARLLELIRSYYEEARSRIRQLNPIRFMYEESPYYEMGYIVGEIIERYRKVIEHAQKPLRFKFYTLFDCLRHVELTQKLYFELYHLVRMLHEIPRKYRGVTEFEDIEQIAGPELIGSMKNSKSQKYGNMTSKEIQAVIAAEERVIQIEEHRKKERKRQKKKFEKARQLFLLQGMMESKGKKYKRPKPWPIDYGWEIEEDKW